MKNLLLILLLLPAWCSAEQQILLIKSSYAPVYNSVAISIVQTLSSICAAPSSRCPPFRVKQITLDQAAEVLDPHPSSNTALIVSIGLEAARLLHSLKLPIADFYTVIPRWSTSELELDGAGDLQSALFIDQPIGRQFQLIRLISRPAGQQVGVLLGPRSGAQTAAIASASHTTGIPVQVKHVSEDREIGPALKAVLDDHQILLALPDPLVYKRKNIRNILLFSYYHQIPVVGFSAEYVKAGAVIAVYSSPSDLGRQIAETIGAYIAVEGGDALPRPMSPKYFSIAVNTSVSRALNFPLYGAQQIADRLRKLEAQ